MESKTVTHALDKHVFPLDQAEEVCKDFVIASWRDDAYTTLRNMFTYSATFLLSVLFLFSSTAKSAARSSSSSNMSDASSSDGSIGATTPSSTKSLATSGDTPDGSKSDILRKHANTFAFETVEEEGNLHKKPAKANIKKVSFGRGVSF